MDVTKLIVAPGASPPAVKKAGLADKHHGGVGSLKAVATLRSNLKASTIYEAGAKVLRETVQQQHGPEYKMAVSGVDKSHRVVR